jgi:hypothetical protein
MPEVSSMRKAVPIIASAALACATAAEAPGSTTNSPLVAPWCSPTGWWALSLRNHQVEGAGCKYLHGPIEHMSLLLVKVSPREDGSVLMVDLLGQSTATFIPDTCQLSGAITWFKGIQRQWEGRGLVQFEYRVNYTLSFDGPATNGTVTFQFISDHVACGAPCTITAIAEGAPLPRETVEEIEESLRKSKQAASKPASITPEHREELLEPIRKMRGPGSCWSVDED